VVAAKRAARPLSPKPSETPAERVARWLDDLQMVSAERHVLVSALRKAALDVAPEVTEEVKYGGLLFSAKQPFCGVFAYSAHVSLEFSQGAAMADPDGVLEGAGKGRRHIKFRTLQDLQGCDLAAYLAQAKRLPKG
jgi:hypothetical protein